jgi:hypothetical protein
MQESCKFWVWGGLGRGGGCGVEVYAADAVMGYAVSVSFGIVEVHGWWIGMGGIRD